MNEDLIKIIKVPENSRLFFVGDIHGMFIELEKLLEKANFDKTKDILVATGDLIDRGTDSHLSISYLKEPWFYTVYGNHEDLLLTEYRYNESPYWKGNGGCWDPKEYSYEDFAKEFVDLPYLIEVEYNEKKIGVVHAGVPRYINDWEELKEKLTDRNIQNKCIWDRTRFNAAKINMAGTIENIDLVISGHSIVSSILKDGNQIFMDTGGFFLDEKFSGEWSSEKNRLTMIEMLDSLDFKVF